MVLQKGLIPPPPNQLPLNSSSVFLSSAPFSFFVGSGSRRRGIAACSSNSLSVSASSAPQALIFYCDGVILESEDLRRQAYNDAFSHFSVRCPSSPSQHHLNWDIHFYDQLQNQIGCGKPKLRWYFKEHGWPSSTVFETPPEDDGDRAKLIDILQGMKLAVCSSATKSSVVLCLEILIGIERFQGLDCFLVGDDVKAKKPDPSIYKTALKRLGMPEKDCLVVEDSVIRLQAATGAGMSCVITCTPSTASQDFKDAIAVYPDLSNVRLKDLELLLQNAMKFLSCVN